MNTDSQTEPGADPLRSKLVQRDAEVLAAGYPSWFRVVEVLSLLAFFALTGVILLRLWGPALDAPALCLTALFLGWVAADFGSGLVHWACDTWGTTEITILGPALIRPFREHHVDPKAITRHDFIETNATNCLATLPLLGAALALPRDSTLGVFAAAFLTALTLWTFLTNQVHKWAHEDAPPALVRALQSAHLILGREHHAIHHKAPFASYYCITTGWLNPVLNSVGFFRRAEALITAWTGAMPRQDDIGARAAREVVLIPTPGLQPEALPPIEEALAAGLRPLE